MAGTNDGVSVSLWKLKFSISAGVFDAGVKAWQLTLEWSERNTFSFFVVLAFVFGAIIYFRKSLTADRQYRTAYEEARAKKRAPRESGKQPRQDGNDDG